MTKKIIALIIMILVVSTPVLAVDYYSYRSAVGWGSGFINDSDWRVDSNNVTAAYDGNVNTGARSVGGTVADLFINYRLDFDSIELLANTSPIIMTAQVASPAQECNISVIPQCVIDGGDVASRLRVRYRSDNDANTFATIACQRYDNDAWAGNSCPGGGGAADETIWESGVYMWGDFRSTPQKMEAIGGNIINQGVNLALIGCGIGGLIGGGVGIGAGGVGFAAGFVGGCPIGGLLGLLYGFMGGLFLFSDIRNNENN